MHTDINSKARFLFAAVLLISVVAGAIWYFLSAGQYATYQIHTQDSVSGLIADAPIEFHGVDVGMVKSVELVNPHSVDIVLNIKRTAPITTASVATITARGLATRGFTGYVYIALEDVGTNSQRLIAQPGERYPTIPVMPSKSVTLDTTMNKVNDNVQIVTALLQSILDKKTIGSLKESVDNLQQVSKVLADNNRRLNSIILNTEQASNQFKPLLESSNDILRTLQAHTLPEAHKTLADLDNLSKPLLESSNDTIKALQTQILPEAHKALSDLDNLTRILLGVVTKINRDPSILIRGTTPPTPGPGESK